MRISLLRIIKGGLPWIVAVALSSLSLHGGEANLVEHSGITWKFSTAHTIGKFANGEPWVIGPVTVIGIDKPSYPLGSTPVGGAMINPIPNRPQGYCPKYTNVGDRSVYDPALDVSLKYPFNLSPGDCLIAARALNTGEAGGNNHVDTVAVLTVLGIVPPEGSFRPAPYGTDRTIRFKKSDLDWTVLKNLERVTSAPTQTQIEDTLPALPWFEWDDQWIGGTLLGMANVASGGGARSNYGREIAYKWSQIALWLNLNHTQTVKEKTMVQTIQCGLDIASFLKQGGSFPANGGHKVGRKFPLLLAAVALNDPGLLALAADPGKFQEDQCTFIVQQSDVGRIVDGGASAIYIQDDVGLPDWRFRPWEPNKDDRRWRDGNPYRYSNWPNMSGQVFAAELMGLKETWGHPPIFAYNDRFASKEGLGDGFVGQMWSKYKLGGGRPSKPKGWRVQP